MQSPRFQMFVCIEWEPSVFALSPAQNFEMIRGIVREEDSLNEALQKRLQTQHLFDAGDSTQPPPPPPPPQQQQQDLEVRCIVLFMAIMSAVCHALLC